MQEAHSRNGEHRAVRDAYSGACGGRCRESPFRTGPTCTSAQHGVSLCVRRSGCSRAYGVHMRYLEGCFAPVAEEVTAYDLPVTGRIPAELNGRYLRNGPNPLGVEDPAVHVWGMGQGMVHGVRLRDGRAEWYRNR